MGSAVESKFADIDKNRSGRIEITELGLLFRSLGLDSSPVRHTLPL